MPDSADRAGTRRLIILFGLAYFAQGMGQAGGLISQPLNYYLKQGLGWNAAQVADYLAVLTIPWIIKPVYGLVSDFIPLLGYRRKSWLMLVNFAAASGFLWLSGLTDTGTILVALVLTAFGTSASDVIVDALMVENGARTGLTARFQGVQWMGFRLAAVLTALTGGYIASLFAPATALHVAATVTVLAPIAVLTATFFLVHEERAPIDLNELRKTARAIAAAFRSPALRIAAAFLALWCFSPGFGTPMYYHMVDTLGFDQKFIGHLGALTAGGGLIGAVIFARTFSQRSVTFRAVFSIVSAFFAILSFNALLQPHAYTSTIAVPLSVMTGLIAQIGMLTILTLAATACPHRAEGFVFAAMMSLYNGMEQLSAIAGARLYQQAFNREIGPLLWVAAVSFLLCFALVPWLKRLEARTT